MDALLSHGAPGLVDLCLANSAPVRPGLVEVPGRDAAPILVDRERIRAMGLELEVSGGLGGGDYARHDPDRLAAAVLDVYRRRAVRIFRGEQRYIIEE